MSQRPFAPPPSFGAPVSFNLSQLVDADFQNVVFTKLRVHFSEITQVVHPPGVDPSEEGGYAISFNTQNQLWFGIKEWNELRQANWNFSKLGITIRSNAPVANFQKVLPRL